MRFFEIFTFTLLLLLLLVDASFDSDWRNRHENDDPAEPDNVTSHSTILYTKSPSSSSPASSDLNVNPSPALSNTFPTVSPSFLSSITLTEKSSKKSSRKPSTPPSFYLSLTPSTLPSDGPYIAPINMPQLQPTVAPSKVTSSSPSPSPILTNIPSLALSLLPNDVIPSISPSKYPSNMIFITPSIIPTMVPSESSSNDRSYVPSSLTFITPSVIPSMTNSFSPMVSSSNDPTYLPTMIVSHIPSSSSSQTESQECFMDDNGIFGSIGQSGMIVDFGYEVEIKSGFDPNKVIAVLENKFSEAILPDFFSDQCTSQGSKSRARFRKLAAVGVSSRPEDTILEGYSCERKQVETNSCVVVQGELTIFIEGKQQNIEDRTIKNLKDGMRNDDFVTDGIERVSFIELESRGPPKLVDGANKGIREDKDSSAVYGIVAGVTAMLLALVILVWRRNQQNDEDEDETASSPFSNDAAITFGSSDGMVEAKVQTNDIEGNESRDELENANETEHLEEDENIVNEDGKSACSVNEVASKDVEKVALEENEQIESKVAKDSLVALGKTDDDVEDIIAEEFASDASTVEIENKQTAKENVESTETVNEVAVEDTLQVFE